MGVITNSDVLFYVFVYHLRIKRRTVEVPSYIKEGRLQCNRAVKITIRGQTSTEELLEHTSENDKSGGEDTHS